MVSAPCISLLCEHEYFRAAALFDHLVSAQQYRWGYGKTERCGGLADHDHLKFCRELHREIARLLATLNAIHIGCSTTPGVYLVDSVGEQTAVPRKLG